MALLRPSPSPRPPPPASALRGGGCVLARPPERSAVDRLARWLEGGDTGVPAAELLDLGALVPGVAPAIADFYRRPQDYAIDVGASAGPWSHALLSLFAALFRQSVLPNSRRGEAPYEVCQRIYRDARGRMHWDRYARVDGALERLFVARMRGRPGRAARPARPARVDETFCLWGIPVRLTFNARADGGALVLTLHPRRSSLFAWPARVTYRTEDSGRAPGELRTRGDFRVPALGLRVETEFHMRRAADR